MWPRAIVTDLDGTLVDTLPDIAAALNLTLERAGAQAIDERDVRYLIGGGARALVGKGFAARDVQLGDDETERYLQDFLAHYADVRAGRSAPFPGAIEALERWRSEGRRLGVCTNKPKAIADIVLADLHLTPFFDCVIGAEDDRPRKPDPSMLTRCLDAIGSSPADAVLLGDTETDLKTARAAGTRIILFTFGYARQDVATLGADAVLDSWGDLDAAFGTLAPAGSAD